MKNDMISKRLMVAVLAGTMVFSAVMTGCGKDSKNDNNSVQSSSVSDVSSGKTDNKSNPGTETEDEDEDDGQDEAIEQSIIENYKDPEYTLGKVVDSGSCGDNLTWELDENGLLVISGSGDMALYNYNNPVPWSSHSENDIKSLIVKKGVTSIGSWAFKECSNLSSVVLPEGLKSIGGIAFVNCVNLAEIKIPDSVTKISHEAFDNTAWYNSQPDGLVYAGKVAYVYKGIMPENSSIVLQDGTKGIGETAFMSCRGLIEITIPKSVEYIAHGAFKYCKNLKSITIPKKVTYIESAICEDCENLKSVTIPNKVTDIDTHAFSGCKKLSNVTIPDTVTYIGLDAFYDCSDDLEIHGKSGTEAEKYANENEIKFIAQ